MAEAIVGPLVGKLQEMAVSEAKALVAVNDDIRGLRDRLMWMQAFLRHADPRRRDTSDELIRVWLKQTRDVAFDAEDAIDDYSLKVDLSRYPDWSQAIVRFFAGFTTQVSIRHNLSRKIAEINLRLEDIIQNKEKYKIEAAPTDFAMITWKPSTNISAVAKNLDAVQPSPIKRENMGKLEEAFFCDNMNRLIVCVTGEGGVGKATLVRELYERPTTMSKFKHQAWVSFPPYLSSSSILQLIHQQLEEREYWCQKKDVERKLHKMLDQKPFLLVIDGEVSNSDWNAIIAAIPDGSRSRIVHIMQGTHKRPRGIASQHWIELQCFDSTKTTSLFNQRVCLEEKTEGQIETGSPLEDVLHGVTKGLPLAIVLLSGLIQTKEHPNEWQAVFDHLKSKKSKRLDSILAMCFDDLPHNLKSCFLYFAALPMNTPIEARQLICMWMAEGFLRPKDGKTMEKVGRIYLNELMIRHLVKFVKMDNVNASDEFVVVHHKVHEFLQYEAQEANFVDIHNGDDIPSLATTRRLSLQNYTDKYAALANSLPKLRSILSNFQEEVEDDEEDEDSEEDEDDEEDEDSEEDEDEEDLEGEGDIEGEENVEDDVDEEEGGEGEEDESKENVAHVDNENDEEDEGEEIIEEGEQNERSEEAKQEVKPSAMPLYGLLRCWETPLSGLLHCCREQSSPRDSSQSYIKELLQVSKFLRVINLQGIEIGKNLPTTIGNVAHLQYLGVTYCSLTYIPSTIENLKTLQTLDVRHTYVRDLPEAFWNITTLRHVFGDGLFLPKQVGDLKHLQTLESIDPAEKDGWDSSTFEKMVHLQSLHVSDSPDNGINAKALSAVIEKANFLEYLDTLTLDVDSIPLSVFISSSLRRLRTLILDGELDMSVLPSNYKESKFCFPNLSFLSLENTKVPQDFIGKLGKLPLLANLILDTDSYKDDQLVFHAGGFKSLTKLTLSDLENLKKLEIEKSALPELTDLEVLWYHEDIKIEVYGERDFVKKIQEEDKFLYSCITVSVAAKKIRQLPSMKQRVAGGSAEVHR
ncbi:unnamed protein product [Urochloa decumbens]|uniref:Uncharacterized protein n=1 Tax=Urochloa decumbens TaxID=240449 RepID=A0ABC9AJP4_9POAL